MYYPYGIWQLQSNAVLPLVYDEALSYGQQIAHLLHRVNELQQDIITVGNILQNGNWTQRIDELAEQINNLVDQQEQTVNQLNQLMDNLSSLQSQTNDLSSKLSSLELTVISYINEMTLNNQKIITDLVNSVRQMVLEQICTRNGENMLVRDPTTGHIISLNATLKNLLEVMASFGGLTMAEYAALNLTMIEYRDLELTMFRYAYAFRLLLIQKSFTENSKKFNELEKKIENQNKLIDYNTTGYNPFTNRNSTAMDLAQQTALHYTLSPTMEEYRNYNLTMGMYAELGLTMEYYRYLWAEHYFFSVVNQYKNMILLGVSNNMDMFQFLIELTVEEKYIKNGKASVPIGISGTNRDTILIDLRETNKNYSIERISGVTLINIENIDSPQTFSMTITFYKHYSDLMNSRE